MSQFEAAERLGGRRRERQARLASELEHDDREVDRLVAAAHRLLRAKGADGVTVRDVLAEARLGTRAFYRHFASRDELVLTVFTEGARREAERLTAKMAKAAEPVEAVVAWIDGRLELAFDRRVAANLQYLSMEAQLRHRQAPAGLELASELMLAPLIASLEDGRARGHFRSVDPPADARSIHDVVWGVVERRWAGFPLRRRETRDRVLRFCLQAIGAQVPVRHVPRRQASSSGEAG